MTAVWSQLDTWYAARQVSILALLAFAPFLCLRFYRRRLAAIGGAALLGTAVALWAIVLKTSASIWSDSSVPYAPLRVGPSPFAIREMLPVVAVVVWAPAAVAVGLAILLRSSKGRVGLATWLATGWCGLFMCAAVVAVEWSHEDTVWARGFSLQRFQAVRAGMSRHEVHALLGPPLQGPALLGPGSEAWVRNWSAGYWAVVAFDGDTVTRAQWWYSD
jgi:hypothetical protein